MKIWELLSVLLEQVVPFLLGSSAVGGMLVVLVVHLLGNDEGLLWVEAKLLLDMLDIVGLERVSVNATSSLELGTEANGGGKLDHGWLVSDLLGLLDGLLDALQVGIAVLDMKCVPSVSLETLDDILSESTLGVTI